MSTKTSIVASIVSAANFAAIKHKDQKRKDPEGTPYINHPIGVAHILTKAGIDDVDVIQGAILHDTVEDTDTTLDEIEAEFGKAVRDIVDEVSDDKDLDKQERKRQQILHAPHASQKAKLVKLADKLYNLLDLERTTPRGWTEERKLEYFVWSAKVILGCRGVNQDVEDLLDEVFERNGVKDPKNVQLAENEKK
eukprot:GFUD01021558.1.p1 GENE.GFUD01021558.1~~GFUD01021558.1.p1  ORF type:complete len:194 (-),score=63.29 GFUD01021558.1:155-736(-)